MSNQQDLGFAKPQAYDGPVECLGMTFENDDARRAHFLNQLREKLQDPEFRKTPGFPVATDVAILQLSDPPYFTACPNPFLPSATIYTKAAPKHVAPLVADVKEGKNDPIYNAHSYHTKVPHKAIMRFLLHYSSPGDVVFDPFAGTGMTGVAASACGGVDADFKLQVESEFRESGLGPIEWGERKAILGDLAPAATFIAHKFTTPTDRLQFEECATRILNQAEAEFSWMYQTKHTDGRDGTVQYVLWSDVFSCPECAHEIVFWDVAVDAEAGGVKDEFACSKCGVSVTKAHLERVFETVVDDGIGETVRQAKQVPVLINYVVDGIPGRLEKMPDARDLDTLRRVESLRLRSWYPVARMPEGGETRRNDPMGLTHVHHFYTRRNLHVLSKLRELIWAQLDVVPALGMWFTSTHAWGTRLNRLLTSNYFQRRGGVIGQTLQGTLYVSSLSIETNLIERFRLRISSVPHTAPSHSSFVTTGSATDVPVPANSVDYIFTDPPFGANIQYSELNVLWESWLQCSTAHELEAVENRARSKTLMSYQHLMEQSFRECFRVLKPGAWMTVEFSNTKAKVWNAIQVAIQRAGFIVASVAALEKEHKGYRAVTTATAVKQDLVISCYKPSLATAGLVRSAAQRPEAVWDFINEHLARLPVVQMIGGELVDVQERTAPILFDRWVAASLSAGVPVDLSSAEFLQRLAQRYPSRGSMYFLSAQVLEYDRARMKVSYGGQESLFIVDEASAIRWLRDRLQRKPQTYQEISPDFIREIRQWQKYERPLELSELLRENFLCHDSTEKIAAQIAGYLRQSSALRPLVEQCEVDATGAVLTSDSRLQGVATNRWYVPNPENQADIEKVRNRQLLREFDAYRQGSKRLKEVRSEAIRLGFSAAMKRGDYKLIKTISSRLPQRLLDEDEQLLLYYDVALTRLGDE
ncbi:MAG: DNA methylase [Deltaproteobacteria bacterium]|nr:MAG: DNA methylase [Deltaproteobacteria bacterium]